MNVPRTYYSPRRGAVRSRNRFDHIGAEHRADSGSKRAVCHRVDPAVSAGLHQLILLPLGMDLQLVDHWLDLQRLFQLFQMLHRKVGDANRPALLGRVRILERTPNVGPFADGKRFVRVVRACRPVDDAQVQRSHPKAFNAPIDVGGGASPEKIANAFRIVRKDPNVKAILLNIFAGINRCDWVAEGVVQAMQKQAISEPVIVRLSGTNYELGQEILNKSGMPFITAADLDDAARKAVDAVNHL